MNMSSSASCWWDFLRLLVLMGDDDDDDDEESPSPSPSSFPSVLELFGDFASTLVISTLIPSIVVDIHRLLLGLLPPGGANGKTRLFVVLLFLEWKVPK